MHLAPLIRDLALILGIAGITTYIFRKIRQPVILGYIVAGIIVGPHTPPVPLITDLPNIQVWADLGVIFVMFSLGLDFSFHKLVRVGSASAVTALLEVLFMLGLGYSTGRLLGWPVLDCFFLAGMLAISSTTIIFKAFQEVGLGTRRFADHVFAILVVEDIVAVLLLVGLSVVAMTQTVWDISLVFATVRLVGVVGGWFLVGYFVIPTFFLRAGRFLDNETITILATGLCLLMVAAATQLGYSAALGAFIMGSILAETREASRIETLIRPLRDLFAAIFFVSVGMLVNPAVIADNWGIVLFITATLIVGKSVGVTFAALVTGQALKPSIQMGLSLAQIGEFSFIIAGLGSQLAVTSDFLYPIAVAVSSLTVFTTPYLVRHSQSIAEVVERALPAKTLAAISLYTARMQAQNGRRTGSRSFAGSLFRFALNAILVTSVYLTLAAVALPLLQARFPERDAIPALVWLAGTLLSAPFVWGMFFAFSRRRSNEALTLAPFLGHLVTLLWVGALSAAFFATATSFILILCAGLSLFLLSYRRLEVSYRWFETRLVKNLENSAGKTEASLQAMAPWDLHLFRVNVNPNSSLVGLSLQQASIRQRFGLNIVAIQRGDRCLRAPTAAERLYPADTLLILGTDPEVEAFRVTAEAADIPAEDQNPLNDYALERVFIDGQSPFAGKTIRESGIRDAHKGLIVGLENGTFRTTNPDPTRVLVAGDILWMVGNL